MAQPQGKDDGATTDLASFKEDADVLDRQIHYAWELPNSPLLHRAGSFMRKVKDKSEAAPTPTLKPSHSQASLTSVTSRTAS